MQKFLPLIVLAFALCSCNMFPGSRGDRRVASIGRDVLYESEIAKLLPQGIESADSVAMVRKYIDTWALSKLLLLKAQEELSKSDRDIDAQIEDYRRVLLGYRLEKKYIETRLDTLVSDSEIEEYFEAHAVNYIYPWSVVKARTVKISTKSPYYEMVRNNLPGDSGMDIDALEELCYSSAEKYNDFSKAWIPLATLAREIEESPDWCEARIAKDRFFEIESESGSCMVYVTDYVAPNELSPLDFNRENIKETIISRRKQDLLAKLEQDLLDDAISTNKLKIYTYDEK